MESNQGRLVRWRTLAYGAWAVIGVLVIIAVALWAIGRISGALVPFGLAFVFVFLTQGLVAALEARGMKRGVAVTACFAAAFVLFSLVVVFVFPLVGRELISFARAIPTYRDQAQAFIDGLLASRLLGDLRDIVVPVWLEDAASTVSRSAAQVFVNIGNVIARGIVSTGSGLATVVFDLFLGAIIAYWTLRDLPKIRAELRVLAGDQYEDDLENLLSTVGRVVGGYLKGQTIASLVTGGLAGIGLALIGVPYALVLGFLTFVLNYVPYIGPLVSGLVASVVGLFVGWPQALGAIAVVVAAQQLTDLFVTPRVMSEQVDLHPTLVIFSLLVGGALSGFWGMILAIPVAATAKGLFVYYWERRTNRSLATEDGALFRSSVCGDDDADDAECEEETHEDSE